MAVTVMPGKNLSCHGHEPGSLALAPGPAFLLFITAVTHDRAAVAIITGMMTMAVTQ